MCRIVIIILSLLCVISSKGQTVFLNEIRADDASTDDGEFIELVGPAGTDISGWQIEHVNGSGGGIIFTYSFPEGTIIPDDAITDKTGQSIGFIIIKRNGHNVDNYDFEWGTTSLQNGPDGIILSDDQSNRIQALTWNGMGDLTGGDPPWRNVGSDQNTDNSLSAPDSVYESYHKDWGYVLPTPGTLNTNQTIGDVSLPVELSSFSAYSQDGRVKLIWITESEMDNLGFILERSLKKNEEYIQIASYESMESLKGAGNSSAKKQYTFIDHSVFNGLTYWYKLIDVSVNGIETYHGPIMAMPRVATEPPDVIPVENYPKIFRLAQNYPNPFNPRTRICYDIAETKNEKSFVNLSIFDINGRKVKTLMSGDFLPGSYDVEWLGTNDQGKKVAGGVYYYQLRTDTGFIHTKKLILLR
jgi:hypothetical protein